MKKHFITLLLVFSGINLTNAQVFDTGMSLYNSGDYERAARIFEQVNEPRGYLFTAKSYYNLSKPSKALGSLSKFKSLGDDDISQDAKLTKALSYFQLDNYASALDELYELSKSSRQTSILYNSIRYYEEILNYLSVEQRYQAYRKSDHEDVRFDLIKSSVGLYNIEIVKQLIEFFTENEPNAFRYPIGELESQLSDSMYAARVSNFRYPKAPEGTMYNIGVALPTLNQYGEAFEVSQHLYFGILLAVEEFNENQFDKKAFINYVDTESAHQLAENKMYDLAWKHNSDVIIGPLFSEMVESYSLQAERFQIPMIAPLANADSISVYRNYTYQFNPSFEIQGKRMAEYAVNQLQYDTLAVLAESNGLGGPSASGFRYRAEELGAHIAYYNVHDLESLGYDIRDYTKVFTTETLLVDSLRYVPVDAIYAPFTGIAAQTLVESLLTDLQALRSEIAILGSEEWENIDLDSLGMTSTELSYTKSFDIGADTLKINDFESNYRLRFNREPTLFSFIGYDVAEIVLESLLYVGNPVYLNDAMRFYRSNDKFTLDVDFNGTHINQKVSIEDYYRPEVISDTLAVDSQIEN